MWKLTDHTMKSLLWCPIRSDPFLLLLLLMSLRVWCRPVVFDVVLVVVRSKDCNSSSLSEWQALKIILLSCFCHLNRSIGISCAVIIICAWHFCSTFTLSSSVIVFIESSRVQTDLLSPNSCVFLIELFIFPEIRKWYPLGCGLLQYRFKEKSFFTKQCFLQNNFSWKYIFLSF